MTFYLLLSPNQGLWRHAYYIYDWSYYKALIEVEQILVFLAS